jgi:hypothetical protein
VPRRLLNPRAVASPGQPMPGPRNARLPGGLGWEVACLALTGEPTASSAAGLGRSNGERKEAMIIRAGCRCDAVRYKIDAERITARHCWCRDCQVIGAGSGTVNVFVRARR